MIEREAERALLGAVLLDPDALDLVELDPADFALPQHRSVFGAMQRLRARGAAIDPVTVEAELGDRAASAGGLAGVTELATGTVTAQNIEHYAGIVGAAALTRRVRWELGEVLSSGLAGEELLERAWQALAAVSSRRTESGAPMGEVVREAMKDLLRALDAQQDGRESPWGVATGYTDLDQVVGGLPRGVVTIVAGRPSMGKSSLVRGVCDFVSARGAGVHVFSLEDRHGTYGLRALADNARVNLQHLVTLRLNRGDVTSLVRAAEDLVGRACWYVDDTKGLSSSQIAMRVRRRRRQLKTELVVVDYVSVMREPKAKDEQDNITKAARGLSQLAGDENVAVVLVSQLSRDVERRTDRRPLLADLRFAGELEEVAETVLMLYRDEYYQRDSKHAGEGEVLVRKNKNGPTGTVSLAWDAATASYRSMSCRREP